MRIWISRNSEVPIGEQLTAQIVLGIIGEDLKPSQRLPSTRELARRLRIHANTVSAAYRDLASRGWVEFRRGSGVYVREIGSSKSSGDKKDLDQMIALLIRDARRSGYSVSAIQTRMKYWLELQPPDHFLLLESDMELRDILAAEITEATAFPVICASPEECSEPSTLAGAAPVALYGKSELIRQYLPPVADCVLLRLRSVPATLAAERLPTSDSLITVISHWPEFLKWARALIVAAGVSPDALSLRDARDRGWKVGLRSSELIVTDVLTAKEVPSAYKPRVFRLIADSSMLELIALRDALRGPAAKGVE